MDGIDDEAKDEVPPRQLRGDDGHGAAAARYRAASGDPISRHPRRSTRAHVVRITLAREKQLNAYSMRMCRELLAALQAVRSRRRRARARAHRCGPRLLRRRRRLGRRPRARRVHAPAARPRARDARRHAARDPDADAARQADDRDDQRRRRSPAVSRSRWPATCASRRRARSSATPAASSALLPDEGGAWLFPRAMGLDRALKMTLLHEVYDAATARAARPGRPRSSPTPSSQRARWRSRRPRLARAAGRAPGQDDDAPQPRAHAGAVAGRRRAVGDDLESRRKTCAKA